MIVVLDTNIWVSALAFGGVAGKILTRGFQADQLAVSDFIETEVLRVLTGKFTRPVPEVREKLNAALNKAIRVRITHEIRGICRDPDDDAILETAWKAKADYLVTGDKDLLVLKEFRGTKIITPAAYLGLM